VFPATKFLLWEVPNGIVVANLIGHRVMQRLRT